MSTNNQIAITNLVRQNGAVHPALGHADPSATSRSEPTSEMRVRKTNGTRTAQCGTRQRSGLSVLDQREHTITEQGFSARR